MHSSLYSRLPVLLRLPMRLLAVLLLCVLPWQGVQAASDADPWEPFNRRVFAFNETVDRYVLKPTAQGYRKVTPRWLNDTITRVFQNARDVPSIVGHVLQWEWQRAGHTSGRVLVNTTLGVGGMFDVASDIGLEKHTTDLGIVLARWGVPSGPYLVLPGMGPSTVRDAAMIWPEDYLHPRSWIEHDMTRYSVTALYVIDIREGLLDIERAIVGDRYIFMRDFYLSGRLYQAGIIEEDDFSSGFEEADWGDDGW
jgi:phospholipid-binding lipoprotein MlaA